MDTTRLTALLRDLVRIPSVNPDDGLDDPAVSGEANLASYLARYLEGLDFEVSMEEQHPGRPNVIAYHGPAHAAYNLLLEAHLDTVSTRDMTLPPFEGEVRDGRLYGRGACDTKGPMAASLFALDRGLLDRLADAGCRLWYVGAIGEEKGAEGAVHLARSRRVEADEAIVMEPTELNIVDAHKGVLWFSVETLGRTAHGSNPSAGVSAVEGMERVMGWLREYIVIDCDDEGRMGPATLNVGRIEGGSAINIVPGRCRIEVDLRTPPGTDHGDLVAEMRRGLDVLRMEGCFAEYRLDVMKDCPPFAAREGCPLVDRLASACRAEGVEPDIAGTAWFSDAGPFSEVCRDILVFGPGSIVQAHTPDEYIDVDDLVRGARILRRFLEETADRLEAGSLR